MLICMQLVFPIHIHRILRTKNQRMFGIKYLDSANGIIRICLPVDANVGEGVDINKK